MAAKRRKSGQDLAESQLLPYLKRARKDHLRYQQFGNSTYGKDILLVRNAESSAHTLESAINRLKTDLIAGRAQPIDHAQALQTLDHLEREFGRRTDLTWLFRSLRTYYASAGPLPPKRVDGTTVSRRFLDEVDQSIAKPRREKKKRRKLARQDLNAALAGLNQLALALANPDRPEFAAVGSGFTVADPA